MPIRELKQSCAPSQPIWKSPQRSVPQSGRHCKGQLGHNSDGVSSTAKVNTLKEGPTATILLCQHISAAYVQKKVQVSPALQWYKVT